MARTILAFPAKTELAKAMTELSALAATLVVYGGMEYAGGYGFATSRSVAPAILYEAHNLLRESGTPFL